MTLLFLIGKHFTDYVVSNVFMEAMKSLDQQS